MTPRPVVAQRSERGNDDDRRRSYEYDALKRHRGDQKSRQMAERLAAMRLETAVFQKVGEHNDEKPYDAEKYLKASGEDEVVGGDAPPTPKHHQTGHSYFFSRRFGTSF